MKRMVFAAMALGAFALPAFAQTAPSTSPPSTSPPASSGPGNSAVNSPNSVAVPGSPVAGANSFTEGQAKSRIEDQGFTAVSELIKDGNGVWRGKATKGGKPLNVSLDFQGNVVAQ